MQRNLNMMVPKRLTPSPETGLRASLPARIDGELLGKLESTGLLPDRRLHRGTQNDDVEPSAERIARRDPESATARARPDSWRRRPRGDLLRLGAETAKSPESDD